MLTHLVFDFSWVLLFPLDPTYRGKLNTLNDQLAGASYHPLDHFRLNDKLLSFLHPLRSKYHLAIFTAGRMHALPEFKSSLDPVFHAYFTENEIGHPKSSPAAFTALAKHLDIKPQDLLFVDDKMENIQAATNAGAQGIQFIDNSQLFSALSPLLK